MKTVLQIMGIVLVVVILVLALPVLMYFQGHNFAVVEEQSFYRSRQMSGKALESTIRKHGIRTVINLRAANPGEPWYDEEVAVCEKMGVAHESFGWSMKELPAPKSLARFVELIETGNKPFLAHCEGGTHRAGVASACYKLIMGADTATARKQFGPMFNDAPIGKLVDLYEGHGVPFSQWVREVYPILYDSNKTSAAVVSQAGLMAAAEP